MNEPPKVELSVSQFVALTNQIMEYAMPVVTIYGELANFKVAKNRWVYFDLVDEAAKVRFFGTVQHLPGPLEDGLTVRVTGSPRLSPQYGFSVNVQSIQPVGEGSINKAQQLLKQKLEKEGLFAPERKRPLPYPPESIGLITSSEAAAYRDFIKVTNARWRGLKIQLADVAVQGEQSPGQIVAAIECFNSLPEMPEVLVITRGGGSADDLAAFSDERVVRAVAASRVPTMVAIGHEQDVSLAELAADQRASTPSNAAELLTPDKTEVGRQLQQTSRELDRLVETALRQSRQSLANFKQDLGQALIDLVERRRQQLESRQQLLGLLSPLATLKRGYAIVKDQSGQVVRSVSQVKSGQKLSIGLADGQINSRVE